MSAQTLEVPRAFRRGGRRNEVDISVEYTLQIIEIMCGKLNLTDLGQSNMLDMGCGWRMTKTLLDHNIPIAEYVGMDVFADMVDFLQKNVTDPRFSFQLLDSHNEMYNPQGKPLAELESLNVPEAHFDIICLFSVFTHLAPHDYVAMLKLLRPYLRPGGKLVFSLFVNEKTDSGLGFIDNVSRNWANNAAGFEANMDKFVKHFDKQVTPDFVDFDPKQPLKWAIYSRQHALQLVEESGWQVEELNDPEKAIQHYMICSPAG